MASHWCDQLVGSGPPLAADNKVYWWSIIGPLSVANDKLFYWSTDGPPSVANKKVDWWPTVGCHQLFMVVFWWRDQLIDSGPPLAANNKVYWLSISGPLLAANDKLFYWSTSGPPSLANNPDSMQTLAQYWRIHRSNVGRHCWPMAFWPADAMSV